MQIVPATAADHPALNRIYRDVRRRDFHWLAPERIGENDFNRDTAGEVIHVAREGDVLLGFISVWTADSFIHHLYVDTAQQARGVGSRLLDFARATYPGPLRLKCVAQNERARRFYAQHGWRVVGSGLSEDGNYLLLESPPAPGSSLRGSVCAPHSAA